MKTKTEVRNRKLKVSILQVSFLELKPCAEYANGRNPEQ